MRQLGTILFCTPLIVACLPRVELSSSLVLIEDAANGNTAGWVVYDSTPAGASGLAVGGYFNFSPMGTTVMPAKLGIDYTCVYQEKDTP